MKRLLFVGQAPGKLGAKPFVGRSGKTVAKLLGVDYDAMFGQHTFVNVVDEFQGKIGKKGDVFEPSKVDAMAKIAEPASFTCGIVLCGKAVARAFGLKKQPYLDWFRLHGKPAMVLPHPSGINMWWNDPKNKTSAQKRLRAFASKVSQ
jgi:uracil-DNA glycosylase